MPAKLVPLGKNGPLVQQLGLGLMGLSYDTYGAIASDEERFVFLDRAYELGIRNFDSAESVSTENFHLNLVLTVCV